MSDERQSKLTSLVAALAEMPADKRDYLLGYAEGVADSMRGENSNVCGAEESNQARTSDN